MGIAMLTPLFLAGAALIAAPFIIHQIRRPEREPVPFSSLMFVPNVQKEVIERKRIQHLLLMLLRMLMLLLLAAAFARPYLRAAATAADSGGAERHYILVDTSYSMGEGDRFDRAKSLARDILADLPLDARVGLAAFGRNVTEMAALSGEGDAGTAGFARAAIDGLTLTNESTDYGAALRFASGRLLPEPDAAPGLRVVHVVSDLQRSGLPEGARRWKVPGGVTLRTHPVADKPSPNLGLTDVALRPLPNGDLRVVGRARNWSQTEAADIPVELVIGGEQVDSTTVTVRPWSATQVSFQIENPGDRKLFGHIRLDHDDLAEDNRRYFTWNAPRRVSVAIVAEERAGERWPAERFLDEALPDASDLPWRADIIRPSELADRLNGIASRPELIIVADVVDAPEGFWSDIAQFVREGSPALVIAPEALSADAANAELLSSTGLRMGDPIPKRERRRPDSIAWVDFEHPVFTAFAGARFNDFSSLYFWNYRGLSAEGEGATILARLEDDSPVIAEARLGEGRLIVWAFPLALNATNLPKHSRFVPVFYETLAYLTRLDETQDYWRVGDTLEARMVAMNDGGAAEVWMPDADASAELQWPVERAPMLDSPGVLRSRVPGNDEWTRWAAVNVDAAEGDLTPVESEEFALKMASTIAAESEGGAVGVVGANVDEKGFIIAKEYGPALLAALVVFLLIESLYMTALSRRPKSAETADEAPV